MVLIPCHVMGGDLTRQYDEFVARGGDTSNLRNGLNSRLMRTTAANIEVGCCTLQPLLNMPSFGASNSSLICSVCAHTSTWSSGFVDCSLAAKRS